MNKALVQFVIGIIVALIGAVIMFEGSILVCRTLQKRKRGNQ